MTSPTTIGPQPEHREGRSVRDIVEYSPEQVNEVWCRRIFRQILQSLELQYAMHMPHRGITPDTIVFHDNGKPLLLPLDIGPPDEREAEDLNALARVLHYAITQELVPMGPLTGRVEGYGAALLGAVDRCMNPDPARRPQTIDTLRELLGIVPPGAPVHGAPPDIAAGLPADALAPLATGAHEDVPAAPASRAHDGPHDGAPPAANDSDPAHDLLQGTPDIAGHDGVLNARPATGHGDVDAARQVPGHDGVPDTRPAADQDDGATARHTPDADAARAMHDGAGRVDAHIAPQAPEHDETRAMHVAPHAPGREQAGEVLHAAGAGDTHAAPPAYDHDATRGAQPVVAPDAAAAARYAPGTPETRAAGQGTGRDSGHAARETPGQDDAHAVPQVPDTYAAAGQGTGRDSGHAARGTPGQDDDAHAVPPVPDTYAAAGEGTGRDSGHAARETPGQDDAHAVPPVLDTHAAAAAASQDTDRDRGHAARGTPGQDDDMHAVPQVPDTHAAGQDASQDGKHAARGAPGHDGAHAAPQVAAHDRTSDQKHAASPAAAPVVTPTARTFPPAPFTGAAAAGRRRASPSSRQRWALAAGVAVFVALALATWFELRDSGPIAHIDLATPQPADATATPPGVQSGGAGAVAGNTSAAGRPATAAAAGAGVAAGLAPGETVVPGSAVPAPAAGARPLPGVVVTPEGNVYKLQIQPWGVVYVDGVDQGVSPPMKRLTLAPGRHTLRITNPNFQERVFDVDTATDDAEINIDFTDTPR